jgi:hypothetical protein
LNRILVHINMEYDPGRIIQIINLALVHTNFDTPGLLGHDESFDEVNIMEAMLMRGTSLIDEYVNNFLKCMGARYGRDQNVSLLFSSLVKRIFRSSKLDDEYRDIFIEMFQTIFIRFDDMKLYNTYLSIKSLNEKLLYSVSGIDESFRINKTIELLQADMNSINDHIQKLFVDATVNLYKTSPVQTQLIHDFIYYCRLVTQGKNTIGLNGVATCMSPCLTGFFRLERSDTDYKKLYVYFSQISMALLQHALYHSQYTQDEYEFLSIDAESSRPIKRVVTSLVLQSSNLVRPIPILPISTIVASSPRQSTPRQIYESVRGVIKRVSPTFRDDDTFLCGRISPKKKKSSCSTVIKESAGHDSQFEVIDFII